MIGTPQIRRARLEETPLLTELTLRSKAYWPYDASFLAAIRQELEFQPSQFLPDFHVYLGEVDGKIFGFYSLLPMNHETVELHDLFIEPDQIGNGYGKLQKFSLFRDLFEQVVQQCIQVGFVKGTDLSVDGTQVSADAHRDRAITRDQLAESARVHGTARRYLEEMELENSVNESTPDKGSNVAKEGSPALYPDKLPLQGKLSTTDPDAALSTKRGPAEFAYYDNYLIDNHSCLILGVAVTPARLSQEIIAAREMLDRATQQFGLQPVSLAADKSYGTGEFLSWLWKRHILPYIPVLDRKHQTNGFYTQDAFTPVPEENAYRCPAGNLLRFVGSSQKAQGDAYCAKASECRICPHKAACTPGKQRRLMVSWYEEVRESVRNLRGTSEFAVARRARRKVEALFSELRNQIRLRKVRLRRLPHVSEQFLLAATVQNLKRLVRFLHQSAESRPAVT